MKDKPRALLIGSGKLPEKMPLRMDYDKWCVINHSIKETGKLGCDIWYSGLMGSGYNDLKGYLFKELVLTSALDSARHRYPPEFRKKVREIKPKWYKLMRNYIEAKPTTGLIALYDLVDMGYFVDVAGFDQYETENRYGMTPRPKVHDFEREKELFLGLQAGGYINDLNKVEI